MRLDIAGQYSSIDFRRGIRALMIINRVRDLIVVQVLMMILALAGAFAKLLSSAVFLSWWFLLYYVVLIILHSTYAIGWQQILKRMPLNIAYANRSIGVIWGMVLGVVIFNETVTSNMIFGSFIIVAGLFLMVKE